MPASALKMETDQANAEPIFVFGTDLGGQHRNEHASFAVEYHGAESAKGSGASGNAYAIPYLSSQGGVLEPDVIRNYIESFFSFADSHPDLTFHISRFACEAQAHDDATMARLFADHPSNCVLPGVWRRLLDPRQSARVLLFDPGAHLKDEVWQKHLQAFFNLNVPLWNVPGVELVSVGLPRMLVANDIAAKKLGLKHRIIAASEDYYKRHAAVAAEARGIWYSTHLICVMDFEQTAQPQQIRVMSNATRNGLAIEQIDSGLY